MRKCEVLRKKQKGEHGVGRKGGRKGTQRKREAAVTDFLEQEGDGGPQETDCSLNTRGDS